VSGLSILGAAALALAGVLAALLILAMLFSAPVAAAARARLGWAGATKEKVLTLALLGFAAVFGAALWWFQTRAFYERIEGRGAVMVQGGELPVAEFEGIDADTSPLKLRACFRIADGVAPSALAHVPAAEDPTPLVAPAWFDCFDAEALAEGLASGPLRAVLVEADAPYGFDRIIAYSPAGRGWMWRQINRCGRAVFEGDPVPEGCPPPPED